MQSRTPHHLPPGRAVTAALTAALALAGCGSGGSSSASPSTAASQGSAPAHSGSAPASTTASAHASSARSAKPTLSTTPPSTPAASAAPICPPGETACISGSPRAKVSGSQKLDANLARALARSDRTLRRVRLVCPRSTGYPIACRLTATRAIGAKPVPLSGTLTVRGVDTQTHTYTYQLTYAPVRHG